MWIKYHPCLSLSIRFWQTLNFTYPTLLLAIGGITVTQNVADSRVFRWHTKDQISHQLSRHQWLCIPRWLTNHITSPDLYSELQIHVSNSLCLSVFSRALQVHLMYNWTHTVFLNPGSYPVSLMTMGSTTIWHPPIRISPFLFLNTISKVSNVPKTAVFHLLNSSFVCLFLFPFL